MKLKSLSLIDTYRKLFKLPKASQEQVKTI